MNEDGHGTGLSPCLDLPDEELLPQTSLAGDRGIRTINLQCLDPIFLNFKISPA